MVTTPNPDLPMAQDTLRAVPLFRELTQPELDLLVAVGRVVAYPKDMVIFREGDKGEALCRSLSFRLRQASDRIVALSSLRRDA